MSWIKTIAFEDAVGNLKRVYRRVTGPDNYIDNILKVHSLRPHTLEGHMSLYKRVLHHAHNQVPTAFMETLGVYVSGLNRCDYCVDHHFSGLKRLLDDNESAQDIYNALIGDVPEKIFSGKELAAIKYSRKLTLYPSEMNKDDYKDLIDSGYDDGEILEINQVVSYFNYANRTVLGLGVNTVGDILGLSPSGKDDEDDWSHI